MVHPDDLVAGLNGTDLAIWKLACDTRSPGRSAARSAIVHVLMAERIASTDPAMALLRGITAEEEGARAVFHALQRHQYPDAGRLKWRSNHEHRAALVPFLSALGHMSEELKHFAVPSLVVEDPTGKPQVRVLIDLLGPNGTRQQLWPDPPLDFDLHYPDGRPYDLAAHVEKMVVEFGAESVKALVKTRSNARNTLLYASTSGVPYIDRDVTSELRDYRRNVFALICVYLLIDSARSHQRFVLQCLPQFLRILELLPPPDAEGAG